MFRNLGWVSDGAVGSVEAQLRPDLRIRIQVAAKWVRVAGGRS